MKKILVVLVAVFGFGISVNAQYYHNGNVEKTKESYNNAAVNQSKKDGTYCKTKSGENGQLAPTERKTTTQTSTTTNSGTWNAGGNINGSVGTNTSVGAGANGGYNSGSTSKTTSTTTETKETCFPNKKY